MLDLIWRTYQPSLIDLQMMQAIGLVTKEGPNAFHLIYTPPLPNVDEEEDNVDTHDVMRRIDNLELQVGVIDANVGELTSLAHGMHQDITMINRNLLAYF